MEQRAPESSGHTEDLAGRLVARLIGRGRGGGGASDATVRAATEIRRRAAAGVTPIGLSRLSQILTPVLTPGAPAVPAQRAPAGVASVDVVRGCPCALLDAPTPAEVAENLVAVLTDGKRVLVTGTDAAALAAVRAAVPAPLRGLCLDAPPPLSVTELRELRSMLVTAPAGRPRIDRPLPPPELVPTAERVAELCQAAGGRGRAPRDRVDLLPELLGQLEPAQVSVLLDTARRCQDTVAAVDPTGDAGWAIALLERVLFGEDRDEFEKLLRRTTDVVVAADRLRDAGDQLAVVGTLPPGSADQLRDYITYLEAGGRSRVYFRSPEQRAAQPVLRHLRLDGVPVKDTTALRQALAFVELIGAMKEIGALCDRLRVPEPGHIPAVAELNRRLDRVEEATRAAEHLRHEVLFIHPNSPVPMPDLDTTERVAGTIVDIGGSSAMGRARERLDAMADMLERVTPGGRDSDPEAAPELAALVAALREASLPAYLDALALLAATSRERTDQRRRTELLERLRAGAPGLAAVWEQAGRSILGTAQFVPLDRLLIALPGEDTADLVLLLGAGSLPAEHLLVVAAAPRLLAVSAGFASAPPPRPAASESSAASAVPDTVLSMLRRAGVPVIAATGFTVATPAEVAEQPPAAGSPRPFPVPAPRESPSIEDTEATEGDDTVASADDAQPAPSDDTEYVVLPLGVLARRPKAV